MGCPADATLPCDAKVGAELQKVIDNSPWRKVNQTVIDNSPWRKVKNAVEVLPTKPAATVPLVESQVSPSLPSKNISKAKRDKVSRWADAEDDDENELNWHVQHGTAELDAPQPSSPSTTCISESSNVSCSGVDKEEERDCASTVASGDDGIIDEGSRTPTSSAASCSGADMAAERAAQSSTSTGGNVKPAKTAQGEVIVNLQGLPPALCSQKLLEAMLDQAGLSDDHTSCFLQDLGGAVIHLGSMAAAETCVQYFHGRHCGGSTPLTAQVVSPASSRKSKASHMPLKPGLVTSQEPHFDTQSARTPLQRHSPLSSRAQPFQPRFFPTPVPTPCEEVPWTCSANSPMNGRMWAPQFHLLR